MWTGWEWNPGPAVSWGDALLLRCMPTSQPRPKRGLMFDFHDYCARNNEQSTRPTTPNIDTLENLFKML